MFDFLLKTKHIRHKHSFIINYFEGKAEGKIYH